jgi:hypothetical protein
MEPSGGLHHLRSAVSIEHLWKEEARTARGNRQKRGNALSDNFVGWAAGFLELRQNRGECLKRATPVRIIASVTRTSFFPAHDQQK